MKNLAKTLCVVCLFATQTFAKSPSDNVEPVSAQPAQAQPQVQQADDRIPGHQPGIQLPEQRLHDGAEGPGRSPVLDGSQAVIDPFIGVTAEGPGPSLLRF